MKVEYFLVQFLENLKAWGDSLWLACSIKDGTWNRFKSGIIAFIKSKHLHDFQPSELECI